MRKTIHDITGTAVSVEPQLCWEKFLSQQPNIIDSIDAVFTKPAKLFEIQKGNGRYYYRSIGWGIEWLIGAPKTKNSYQPVSCIRNLPNDYLL